jgi:hypothetical protein
MAILEYIAAIWYILWPFGNLVANWYIFPHSGILNKEKSGNPAWNQSYQYSYLCAHSSDVFNGLYI